MSEPLLPTPSGFESDPTEDFLGEMDGSFDPQARMYLKGRKWHAQRTLRRVTAFQARTSASSQGSEGSTSPSKPTGSDASDRSSTSQPALPFSNDTGPDSRDGEMSGSSVVKPGWLDGRTKDYSEAVALYEQGWSVGKVADHYGVTRQSMWKILRRRTELRSRDEAMALTRMPETKRRRKQARTRRRYRQRAARITVPQMKAVRARDVVCQMCGDEGTDFDHILAVSLGGQTTLDNLQLLCHPCHVEKSKTDRRLAAAARRGEVMPQVVPISSSEATRNRASPSPTPASAAAPTTRATSGPSSPVLLASFDPDGCCWRTFQATLASELPRFSQTLPRSGMTRDGRLYALQMSALPIVESDGSASLNVPTPTASDAIWGDKDHSRNGIVGNHNLGLTDWVKTLPTPTLPDALGSLGDLTQRPSPDGKP